MIKLNFAHNSFFHKLHSELDLLPVLTYASGDLQQFVYRRQHRLASLSSRRVTGRRTLLICLFAIGTEPWSKGQCSYEEVEGRCQL